MKTISSLFALAAVLSAAAASALAAPDTSQWKCESCPYEKTGTSGVIEAGIGAVSSESARFGDYTGLDRKGAFLVLGGSLRYRGTDGYYGNLAATDLGLDTRTLQAAGGKEGVFGLRFGYAEIPHWLSDTSATPFLGVGSGTLTLPAGYPAASTASMPLGSTLQAVDLGFKRTRSDLGATWYGGDNWTHRVSLRHDVRDGTQRMGGSFFSSTTQLAAPVDQTTDQLEVSTSFSSRQFQATLAYQASLFREGQAALTWANPFSPVVTGATRGQLALPPDNQFHQIALTAGYQLNPQLQASADIAVGRMTQDEPFLAATLNPTLTAPLPATSLQGRADTFNGSLRVTALPLPGVRVNASVNRDKRDNRTPLAGYPALSTDMFLDPTPRNSQRFSFTQTRYRLNGDVRGPGSLLSSAGFEQNDIQRTLQDSVSTSEATVWGKVAARPLDYLGLSVKVAHAERSHAPYGVATWVTPAQNPLLRKYNLAARTRNTAGARADIAVGEKINIGFNADLSKDDYNETLLGLTGGRTATFGGDLAWNLSEQTQLNLFVQTERTRSRQTGSQAYAQPDWAGLTEDAVDVAGLGLKHAAMKGQLELGGDLVFSRSRSDVSMDNGAANPAFPRATTALDSFKLHATYKLQDNLSLTGSYWYEHYTSQDWRLEGVLPGTVGNLLAFGEQPPHYSVNVIRLALRYRF